MEPVKDEKSKQQHLQSEDFIRLNTLEPRTIESSVQYLFVIKMYRCFELHFFLMHGCIKSTFFMEAYLKAWPDPLSTRRDFGETLYQFCHITFYLKSWILCNSYRNVEIAKLLVCSNEISIRKVYSWWIRY